ncbi:MAG: hypothetical protein HQL31_05455 [Planctomycetes bacterium]|nr:hypothetical protein [Planctomycetota bacterium]
MVTAVILIAYPGFYFPWTALGGGDCVSFHHPYLEAMRRGIGEHFIPLWFNEVYAGGYGLAEVGLGFAYPFHQLLRVFSTVTVIKLEFLFHGLLLFFGLRIWLRLWLEEEFASVFAALLGLLSFQHTATMLWGHMTVHASMAYFPWLLYFTHRLALAEPGRDAIGFASLVALTFGVLWYSSHPQFIMMFSEAAFLYLIFLQVKVRKKWIHSGTVLFIAALLLGVGVGWVQFYETLSAIEGSGRQVTRSAAEFLMSGSLHPLHLIKWISPYLFGIHGSYWGPHEFWLGQLFCGQLALLPFLLGWKRLPRFFKIVIVLCILLAFGRYTPLHGLYSRLVPGAGLFRFSSRFLYVLLPFISLSTGYGIERMIRGKSLPHWLALPLTVLILFVATSHALNLPGFVIPARVLERWNLCQTPWYVLPLYMIELLLVFALVWVPGKWRKRIVGIFILPVFLHLWLATSFASGSIFLQAPPFVPEDESGIPARIIVRDTGSIHNYSINLGIHSLIGYSDIISSDYRAFLDTLCAQDWQKQNRVQVYGLSDKQMKWLDIAKEYECLGPGAVPTRLVQTFPDRRGRYFLADSFMDIEMRAESPFSQIIQNKQRDLETLFCQRFQLDSETKLGGGSAIVIQYGREEVVLSVECSSPVVLASSENTASIWTVEVDGRPDRLHRWMGCFRSVFLDKGHHKVRFFIDRQGFNLRCSISGLLALLLFCCAIPCVYGRSCPISGRKKQGKQADRIYPIKGKRQ